LRCSGLSARSPSFSFANCCQRAQVSSEQAAAKPLSDTHFPAKSVLISTARSRNATGQWASAGSGYSAAQTTARHAANGRRAHQMCRVEMGPCRMLFSRRAWAEIFLIGRSTSMRRLG